jgi:hypothetical protein
VLTMTNLNPDEQINRPLAYLASKQFANGRFCGYRMEYLEEPNPRDFGTMPSGSVS